MADIYLQGAFGTNRLRRGDGSGGYDYFGEEFALGIRFLEFSWNGDLQAELGYSHLSGDEEVLGSYRDLIFTRIGYRQSFLTYLFASIRAGVGYNRSHINFGEGTVPLPDESGMPLLLSGQLGGEYCFGRHPCVELFAAPFYEMDLVGRPDYDNWGFLFGAGFRFDLGRTVSYEEFEAVSRERDTLRSRPPSVVEPAPEPPPCPQPVTCPECPPPPAPVVVQPDLAELLAQDPIRGTVILFANESTRLSLQEDQSHGVRTGVVNPQLELVVTYLRSHPGSGIRIHGHANETGQEDQNRTLSEQRTEAVAAYLRRHGVSDGQIVEVIGHGSAQPLNPERPEDSMNRAVRFEEVTLP